MTTTALKRLGVGIIGCGSISTTYLRLAPLFRTIEVRGVADIDPAVAEARAREFGVPAMRVDELLADPSVAIIVNLTIPTAHASVTRSILEAGKHAYSEKPFVLSLAEGEDLRALCESTGLRIGSAPDTFLGGAHQTARKAIDEGTVGRIASGTCHVMSHGMEHWHPNPDFFYQPGAGPILDLGPYYITNLLQLLGPVKQVAALTTAASTHRTITSQPRAGETIPVDTPTTIHALLAFDQGASITLSASWDVWAHRHEPMELYGTDGSLYIPDPNFFGGAVQKVDPSGEVVVLPDGDHPFGVEQEVHGGQPQANYRASGLADMAAAIQENRPHRCAFDLALHAVDVMGSILKSGETGTFITPSTRCARPAPLSTDEAKALLA
jgi:predicted dehydrogenase